MNESEDVNKISEFLCSLSAGFSDNVDTINEDSSISSRKRKTSDSNDSRLTHPSHLENSEDINSDENSEDINLDENSEDINLDENSEDINLDENSEEQTTSELKKQEEELKSLWRQNCDYEEALEFFESCLLKYLAECAREITTVSHTIENRKIPGSKERKEVNLLHKAKVAALHKYVSFPYFKNILGYPAPANMVTRKKEARNWLLAPMIVSSVHWNNEQKRKLETSILTLILEEKQGMGKPNKNQPFKTPYSGLIDGMLTRSCFGIGNSPEEIKRALSTEVGDKEKEYDWLRISVCYLDGTRSAHECRAIWFNYLHPRIKKTEWSEDEDNKLKHLAEENMYQNWEKIAKDMGTGRSAYQCNMVYHFQSEESSSHLWTSEESLNFQRVVKKIKFKELIPWRKVSYFFDHHNGSDVYRKWTSEYADLKKGKFSKEEDIILCFGLKQCGPKWSEIAEYFTDRHNIQLRGRLQVLRGRDSGGPWSPADDVLLKGLVEKYGWGNWSKMSEHFCNRTPAQIRTRSLSMLRRQSKEEAGVETRALAAHPKTPSESRRIADVMESARNVLERKRIGIQMDDNDKHIMDQLSKVFKSHKKRGRKPGKTVVCYLTQQYRNFFFMGSDQRGGRGKNICVKSAIPDMAFDLIAALTMLDAQIYLPANEDILREDIMPAMDKDVVRYLIQMKEEIESKSKVIKFVKPNGVKEIHIPISTLTSDTDLRAAMLKSLHSFKFGIPFPCTQQNLVGLRTIILNQQNITAQCKGLVPVGYKCKLSGKHSKDLDITSIERLSSVRSIPRKGKRQGKRMRKGKKKSSKLEKVINRLRSKTAGSTSPDTPLRVTPVVRTYSSKARSSTAHSSKSNSTVASSFPSTGKETYKSNSVCLEDPSPLAMSSPCELTCLSQNLPVSCSGASFANNTVSSTSFDISSSVPSSSDQDVILMEELSDPISAGESATPDIYLSMNHDVETSESRNMDVSVSQGDLQPSISHEEGPLPTAETGSSGGVPNETQGEGAPTSLNMCPDEGTSGSLNKDHAVTQDVGPSDSSGLCRMVPSGTNTSDSCTTSQSTKASTSTASSSCMYTGAKVSVLGKPFPTSSDSNPKLFVNPEVFKKIQFSHASMLFQKRFHKLFFWPSVFSVNHVPKDLEVRDMNSLSDDESEVRIQDDGSIQEKNVKRGRKKKKRNQKKMAQNTDSCNTEPDTEKPKRQYVKTGKYSRKKYTGPVLRKSERNPKKKNYD